MESNQWHKDVDGDADASSFMWDSSTLRERVQHWLLEY